MRRAVAASALLALCLTGCATDKSFEKQILGHPAPESPTDTGWPRTSPPPRAATVPPPPPPMPAPPAPTPPPFAEKTLSPRPAVNPVQSKPFAPAPEPAKAFKTPPGPGHPTSAPAPEPHTTVPHATSGLRLTFQAGEFAHAETAKKLQSSLESRGFTTRVEQGKRNKKVFYKVYATKEGHRAELEAQMLSCGVTEPRLTEERSVGAATAHGPAGKNAPAKGAAAKEPAVQPQPALSPSPRPVAPKTATPVPEPTPAARKPSAPIAPPIVEPAPPLPDGYVPPPKKTDS